MAAYLFGKITVTDPSWLPEYQTEVVKLLENVGATYVVRSTETELLEGDCAAPSASIIIEFPSMQVARDWYHSPEYQRLVKLRQSGSTIELFLADGV